MKILSLNQIKDADQYCIDNEDISSIELMERAARKCYDWIINFFDKKLKKVILLAGRGKNGGDGLSLAKMLSEHGIIVTIYELNISNNISKEFIFTKKKIIKYGIELKYINDGDPYPSFKNEGDCIIDAIFGIGLNRPINNPYWISFFHFINEKKFKYVISIDVPSGLFIEEKKDILYKRIIKSTHTLTFQVPKLPFFFPDYEDYIGKWFLLDIGWKEEYTHHMSVKNFFIDKKSIHSIYKKRKKFTHKGNYGHGLLIGGKYGMMGSMVLSAKACLRIGIGKLSVYVPSCGYQIIQTLIPEVIVVTDPKKYFISKIPTQNLSSVNTIGIGMGIGKNPETSFALETFLKKNKKKSLVIDADGINILSDRVELLSYLPEETILTPHYREFSRLYGTWINDYQKLDKIKEISIRYTIYIVLKGAHTVISTPDGELYFNSTGNPGMSTAGSGDVLTGIITGLLSQGYSPKESCLLGVYIHGLSGDLASMEKTEESIIAGDIIDYIGKSYQKIRK
ncbi:NAD(P)H-hydrate dehydratase [Blattabacterium cuenoti]|uniref:NAD(P)H-hydrate dehydratase n=1 Tax=Blattabacterium cuenoti TaxID=1653831 RepID=UPI00163C60D6|nr:NAD(P)H-hydrate dehydratase [Blattabacterium cuenoti]